MGDGDEGGAAGRITPADVLIDEARKPCSRNADGVFGRHRRIARPQSPRPLHRRATSRFRAGWRRGTGLLSLADDGFHVGVVRCHVPDVVGFRDPSPFLTLLAERFKIEATVDVVFNGQGPNPHLIGLCRVEFNVNAVLLRLGSTKLELQESLVKQTPTRRTQPSLLNHLGTGGGAVERHGRGQRRQAASDHGAKDTAIDGRGRQ